MLPPQKGSGEVADVEKKAELEKKGLERTDDLLLLSLWPRRGDLEEDTGLDQLT